MEIMKQLSVTIIITSHNYRNFVSESIESALKQTYSKTEVLVIDDGSVDGSVDVIKSFSDEATVINRKNKGVVFTRNEGLLKSKGDYLIFLDADDVFELDYVERLVNHAIKYKADIVYGDLKMFGSKTDIIKFPEFSIDRLKNQNFINVSSLVRKEAIGKNKFDQELSGKTHEDWDFFLGLCLAGAKAVKCPDAYLNYRQHDASRNNTLSDVSMHKEYVEVYSYIINKYSKLYPDQINYLTGLTFSDWYLDLYHKNLDNINLNKQLKHEIEVLKDSKKRLETELESVYNSESWKITSPLRKIKKRLG